MKKSEYNWILSLQISLFLGIIIMFTQVAKAQLPTGVTAFPIYDTSKAGLSFKKDKLSIVGMWEIPGKPKHFLVVGYFGFMWTLYPDTTKPDTMAAWGPIKRYSRTQVANFNSWVMKGWEFGALGGGFDPNFVSNRRFYVIYNKYPDPSQYRAGLTPIAPNDGPGNPNAIVVIDRYIMSLDYQTAVRDTEMIRIPHGSGYGSSNMVFGSDGLLYISTDAYNTSSWDSTILARKILRIDVSKQDPGRMYSIPPSNPWFKVSNPNVKKEVYAFGFRNTYSLSFNYLTNQLYGAETGQSRWEEINHILPGKNYGWNNGGDGSSFGGNSQGIEGPCHKGNALDSTSGGSAFTSDNNASGKAALFQTPYSRTITGTSYDGTYSCANFKNPTWFFGHNTTNTDGLSNSLQGIAANVGNISPVIRGAPSSPFYGHILISDINHMNFLAIKNHGVPPVNVGKFPGGYVRNGDLLHNGITTWSEDAYGNLYPILLSSSSSGAFQWHDIFMLSHPQLTPLTNPRGQVTPVPIHDWRAEQRYMRPGVLVAAAFAGKEILLPEGYVGVSVHDLRGQTKWLFHGSQRTVKIPPDLGNGVFQFRFLK